MNINKETHNHAYSNKSENELINKTTLLFILKPIR